MNALRTNRMQTKNSFNTGLRIGTRYFSPCQWHDDALVFLDGNEVTVYWSAKDREPHEVYTVPIGTPVYWTDDEGETLLGNV
jgi:hypothetical protein